LHRFLHGHEYPLAFAGLLTLDEGGEEADQEVHAGVAVAERGAADSRRAVPEARRRGAAAGALGHVLVRLDVGHGRAIGEALDHAEDQARVELMDTLPGEALAVERARRHVFDHHVGAADQILQDRLPFGRLGVDLERPLVAVDHGEVQGVRARDVAQLDSGVVSGLHALDFYDLGAEPRHHLRTRRSGLHAGVVDNFDSFER